MTEAPGPDGPAHHVEKWSWELLLAADECAVILLRDDTDHLAIPLTPAQVELLFGRAITMDGVLGGDPPLGIISDTFTWHDNPN